MSQGSCHCTSSSAPLCTARCIIAYIAELSVMLAAQSLALVSIEHYCLHSISRDGLGHERMAGLNPHEIVMWLMSISLQVGRKRSGHFTSYDKCSLSSIIESPTYKTYLRSKHADTNGVLYVYLIARAMCHSALAAHAYTSRTGHGAFEPRHGGRK